MRVDEYVDALPLLPPDLRERAEALRPCLRRDACERCRQVAETVEYALIAARYDDVSSAAKLLKDAEGLRRRHDDEACPATAQRPTNLGRVMVSRWVKASTDHLVAATDASVKGHAVGIAYVVSDGQYGLRGRRVGRLDPSGPSLALVNELRAVELLLSSFVSVPQQLTVLVDSSVALSYLERWQDGETGVMPDGYSLRPRFGGSQPSLVRLAERVASLPRVSFRHVKAHAGHPLNEAADALSSMACRRVSERFDLAARA